MLAVTASRLWPRWLVSLMIFWIHSRLTIGTMPINKSTCLATSFFSVTVSFDLFIPPIANSLIRLLYKIKVFLQSAIHISFVLLLHNLLHLFSLSVSVRIPSDYQKLNEIFDDFSLSLKTCHSIFTRCTDQTVLIYVLNDDLQQCST